MGDETRTAHRDRNPLRNVGGGSTNARANPNIRATLFGSTAYTAAASGRDVDAPRYSGAAVATAYATGQTSA